VRFIQLYHRGWDQHDNLPSGIKSQCYDTDQPTAALLMELKERGLLEDTLVIWGGEFGRTVFSQGKLTADNYGRDHHPRCFSIWMAARACDVAVTNDVPEAQFPEHRGGNLGGPEAWCAARNTMPQAGARSFFGAGRAG
jgi:arylsulfatase A-like enzyme